ncbi:MAG: hypothetical protein M1429_02245 [Patescibacteria group bacterium]|nr:hypothetical protein [Patescibacteria group bacterium]
MENKKEAVPLEQIVREKFSGPFLLRAVKANPYAPESVKFIPVDEDKFVARMELDDEFIRIFPVAAFQPKVGTQYTCYARRRPNASIIEAVPIGYETMAGNEWQDKPVVPNFDVTFKEDKGRYWGKHPKTGQTILPHEGWTMPPAKDGAITVPAGSIELRPTCTRTFYIAGAVGSLSLEKIPHGALETYESNGEEANYSYLPQFRLFGQWWTVFQVVDNPFRGLFEADDFTLSDIRSQTETICRELERWASRELLPLLHPDYIASLNLVNTDDRNRLLEIADETRNNLRDLTIWFKGWVAFAIQDVERRRIAGKRATVKIPEPFGKIRKCNSCLTSKNRAELEKMFYLRKPASKPVKKTATVTPTSKVSKPSASKPIDKPTTAVKPAAHVKPPAKSKGKLAPINGEHSELSLADANPNAAATLAALSAELKADEAGKANPSPFEGIIDGLTTEEQEKLDELHVYAPDDLLNHITADLGKTDNIVNRTGISKSRLKAAIKKIKQLK